MFLCVMSPAKTLQFEDPCPPLETDPCLFPQKRDHLLSYIQSLSVEQIQSLLGVSESLARLNHARFAHFYDVGTPERAAIFAYRGDVYQALDARHLSEMALRQMNDRLLILSALYGLLRPLDRIRPYRLEMDAPLKKIMTFPDPLSVYWRTAVQSVVLTRMSEMRADFLLNLASDQYFAVLEACPIRVVKVVFQEYRQGRYQGVSFLMKKARGMMLRYIMSHNIVDEAGVMAFSEGGYAFDPTHSTADEWLFRRPRDE